MTRALFAVDDDGNYTSFAVFGHADDGAVKGTDLFCAWISSAVYLTVNTVSDVFGCRDNLEFSAKDGNFLFRLRRGCPREAYRLLQGLSMHMRSIQKQYPDKLQVRSIKTSTISEVRKHA
ncbi:MAG: ribosomal-processing cysteine protease Prp [Clostridia bacterium]|nr:ribosomal-processing cysteine protease Prp [Clostridia bacterium]